jgi:hypothetical protein
MASASIEAKHPSAHVRAAAASSGSTPEPDPATLAAAPAANAEADLRSAKLSADPAAAYSAIALARLEAE